MPHSLHLYGVDGEAAENSDEGSTWQRRHICRRDHGAHVHLGIVGRPLIVEVIHAPIPGQKTDIQVSDTGYLPGRKEGIDGHPADSERSAPCCWHPGIRSATTLFRDREGAFDGWPVGFERGPRLGCPCGVLCQIGTTLLNRRAQE